MAYLLGENINIGIGQESAAARGTAVAPTKWLPGRSPTGIHQVVEKAIVRETRAGRINSQGSEVVQKRVEGDLEFNLHSDSIGGLLLALFGKVTTQLLETGVYEHVFEVLPNNPQHPTLTLALSQAGTFQDYEYAMALVRELSLRTPVDDLINATASFIAKVEATHAAYTPAFPSTDYYFRKQDVTFKLATNLAGLTAAPAVTPKEFDFSINNNARPNQVLNNSTAPNDMLALIFEIAGNIRFDYQDETYHDLVAANTQKSMRIEMERADILIGATKKPKLTIDLAKVTFEQYEPERPIDDIVTEPLPFMAHYSDADSKAITVTLVNTTATYAVA